MKYHNITTDDMLNGDGLRTVLWLSGCNHRCPGCHNPTTWDPDDGLVFDGTAEAELIENLKKDYISGLTLSGGDPLHPNNREDVKWLLDRIWQHMKIGSIERKTIWIYTGYTWETLMEYKSSSIDTESVISRILSFVDVLVDGPFIESLADTQYHWAGSTNQRVIDVQKSLAKGEVVLHGETY